MSSLNDGANLKVDIQNPPETEFLSTWLVGNGDSAWQAPERPMDPDARTFSVASFSGLAQVLLQVNGTDARLIVSGEGLILDSQLNGLLCIVLGEIHLRHAGGAAVATGKFLPV